MKRLFIFTLLMLSNHGWAMGKYTHPSCAEYLNHKIDFGRLEPADGPTLLEMFPYAVLPSLERRSWMAAYFSPPTPMRVMIFGGIAPLEDELIRTLNTSLWAPPVPFKEIRAANPEWSDILIGVQNIREFWPEAPVDTFEAPGSPLIVVPREWQSRLLQHFLRELPTHFPRQRVQALIAQTASTPFALNNFLPPSPGPRLEDIDLAYPGKYELRALLHKLRQHYFADRKMLDEGDVWVALERHIYFKVLHPGE